MFQIRNAAYPRCLAASQSSPAPGLKRLLAKLNRVAGVLHDEAGSERWPQGGIGKTANFILRLSLWGGAGLGTNYAKTQGNLIMLLVDTDVEGS